MSKYTTEIRFYCETLAGLDSSVGYSQINSIVQKAAPLIFEDFPIWDEAYRLTLETKILKHYYTREIAAETPGLWKLWLNTRMNEIMPYFNKLYESAHMEFNPFYDVDITRDHTGTGTEKKDGSSSTTGKSGTDISQNGTTRTSSNADSTRSSSVSSSASETHDHLDKYSNTPQGSINGPIFSDYLTDARDINDQTSTSDKSDSDTTDHTTADTDTSSNSTSTQNNASESSTTQSDNINTTEQYLEHVYGKQGAASYASLLIEYRETLINIDKMIIDELTDLFFNLY